MPNQVLDLIINNYCKQKGITDYVLTPARWLSRDWNKKLQLGTSIAFFYDMRAMFLSRVEQNGVGDIGQHQFDYGHIFIASYEAANIRIESREGETSISFTEIHAADIEPLTPICIDNNFIAIHTSEVQLKSEMPENYIPVISGYFNYLLLTPIATN